MERVEFVLRHQIEIILDLFFVEEVAGDVQQQAAPAKSGRSSMRTAGIAHATDPFALVGLKTCGGRS